MTPKQKAIVEAVPVVLEVKKAVGATVAADLTSRTIAVKK